MDIGSISSALGGLKTAFDLTKAAVAARDDNKLAEAKQALNDRIIDVQNAALQLQEKHSAARDEIDALKDEKRKLSARIAEIEQKNAEREKYDLKELSDGVFVLAEVGPSDDGRSPHYLCQPCMDNSAKKGVLKRELHSFQYVLTCPVCGNKYASGEFAKISL